MCRAQDRFKAPHYRWDWTHRLPFPFSWGPNGAFYLLVLLLALYALIVFTTSALAARAPTVLKVAPQSDAVATQILGSPAAPPSFTYALTSNRGWINWRIIKPAWLCANQSSGRTAFSLVLSVCGAMPVGVHAGTISFIASTNTITFGAQLTVTAVMEPPPPPPPRPGGAWLDDLGGVLVTDNGDRLMC